MTYPNITSVNVSAGFTPVILYVQEVTDFWFLRLILFGWLIIITFAVFAKSKDFSIALSTSTFSTAIIAGLMRIPQWIDEYTLGVTIAFAVVGVLVLLFSDRT